MLESREPHQLREAGFCWGASGRKGTGDQGELGGAWIGVLDEWGQVETGDREEWLDLEIVRNGAGRGLKIVEWGGAWTEDREEWGGAWAGDCEKWGGAWTEDRELGGVWTGDHDEWGGAWTEGAWALDFLYNPLQLFKRLTDFRYIFFAHFPSRGLEIVRCGAGHGLKIVSGAGHGLEIMRSGAGHRLKGRGLLVSSTTLLSCSSA